MLLKKNKEGDMLWIHFVYFDGKNNTSFTFNSFNKTRLYKPALYNLSFMCSLRTVSHHWHQIHMWEEKQNTICTHINSIIISIMPFFFLMPKGPKDCSLILKNSQIQGFYIWINKNWRKKDTNIHNSYYIFLLK